MKRLLVLLLAILGCWLGSGSAGLAYAAPAFPVSTYTYDGPADFNTAAELTANRGPPPSTRGHTTYDAVDRWSHGTIARPGPSAAPSIYIYDNLAGLVEATRGIDTSLAGVHSDPGALLPFARSPGAANNGNRVFWSGGDLAKNAAADYAKANGGRTLEMTLTGRALEKIPYNRFTKPVTGKLWDAASWRFARSARGDAHVFFGPNAPRPGSVFARIEGPILDRRGNTILQHFLE